MKVWILIALSSSGYVLAQESPNDTGARHVREYEKSEGKQGAELPAAPGQTATKKTIAQDKP